MEKKVDPATGIKMEVLEEIRLLAEEYGVRKVILKTAYQMGMIKDKELWLNALQDRNNVAHAYNQAVALGILEAVKATYYQMFCDLKKEIETNWI